MNKSLIYLINTVLCVAYYFVLLFIFSFILLAIFGEQYEFGWIIEAVINLISIVSIILFRKKILLKLPTAKPSQPLSNNSTSAVLSNAVPVENSNNVNLEVSKTINKTKPQSTFLKRLFYLSLIVVTPFIASNLFGRVSLNIERKTLAKHQLSDFLSVEAPKSFEQSWLIGDIGKEDQVEKYNIIDVNGNFVTGLSESDVGTLSNIDSGPDQRIIVYITLYQPNQKLEPIDDYIKSANKYNNSGDHIFSVDDYYSIGNHVESVAQPAKIIWDDKSKNLSENKLSGKLEYPIAQPYHERYFQINSYPEKNIRIGIFYVNFIGFNGEKADEIVNNIYSSIKIDKLRYKEFLETTSKSNPSKTN